MRKIYALTDYKGYFGSKWGANPYRSGFDKNLLKVYFNKYGYQIDFIPFKDVTFKSNLWKDNVVLYTSSEDIGLFYKSYIEDIVLGLENVGAYILPRFDFLRANNNKVYMETMRDRILGNDLSGNTSKFYGTFEELFQDIQLDNIHFPCVIKKAEGALSRGVWLINNKKELFKYAKIISRSPQFLSEIKDYVRSLRHTNYKPESRFRNKFIVQQYIPGLKNDWKVLIYGYHYYILNRGIRKNDFRASGSHYNYKGGINSQFPMHMLDMVEKVYKSFNIPHLSLDFAYDGQRGYIHEFQAVYFGTSTTLYCDEYFIKKNGDWITEKKVFDQEEDYVWGLVKYFENHPELFKK